MSRVPNTAQFDDLITRIADADPELESVVFPWSLCGSRDCKPWDAKKKTGCGPNKPCKSCAKFSELNDALMKSKGSSSVSKIEFFGSIRINHERLSHFFKDIQYNYKSITALDFSRAVITADHAQCVAERLFKNSNFHELKFEFTKFEDNSLNTVVQSIPTIEKSIKEVKFITAIRLRFCNLSADDIEPLAEAVKANHTILCLDISNNRIGHKGCEHLCNALLANKSVEILNIFSNNIAPQGAARLGHYTENSASLAELNVGSNDIRSAGVMWLAEGCKTVTSLDLSDNYATKKEPTKNGQGKTVPGIWDKDGYKALAGLIARANVLTELNLAGNDLRCEGIAVIAQKLESSNRVLLTLNIASNNIRDQGAEKLLEAFKEPEKKRPGMSSKKKNDVLSVLDIRGNQISLPLGQAIMQCVHNNAQAAYDKTESVVEKMLDEIDKDGDGTITLYEFIELYDGLSKNRNATFPEKLKAFKLLDDDDSGEITREEFREAYRQGLIEMRPDGKIVLHERAKK